MINYIPTTAVPVGNDENKEVIINSISGAFKNWPGTVVYGPYKFTYKVQIKNETTNRCKEKTIETCVYWNVLLKDYDLILGFAEKELKFI